MEAEGSLVIAKVDEEDEAKYQCLAKNVVGTRGSAKAQLSVLGMFCYILGHTTKIYAFYYPFPLKRYICIRLWSVDISAKTSITELGEYNLTISTRICATLMCTFRTWLLLICLLASVL